MQCHEYLFFPPGFLGKDFIEASSIKKNGKRRKKTHKTKPETQNTYSVVQPAVGFLQFRRFRSGLQFCGGLLNTDTTHVQHTKEEPESKESGLPLGGISLSIGKNAESFPRHSKVCVEVRVSPSVWAPRLLVCRP